MSSRFQVSDEIRNLTTTGRITIPVSTADNTPVQKKGSLIFDPLTLRVYYSDGTMWNELGSSSYGSLLYRDIAFTTFPVVVPPTTPVSSNVPIKLPLDTGTYPTTLGANSGDFDMPVQARLRYIGTQSKVFQITIDMDGFQSGPAFPIFYIAINGLAQLDTSNIVTGFAAQLDRHLSLITTLSTNDYIEMFVSIGNVAVGNIATSKANICAIEI